MFLPEAVTTYSAFSFWFGFNILPNFQSHFQGAYLGFFFFFFRTLVEGDIKCM